MFGEKRILVTGGTRGIGRATVEAFLRAGARVAVNGSNEASVDRAMKDLDAGSRAVAVPGNLGDVVECQRVVEGAIAGLGGLDVLVNNAGVGGPGKSVEETTPAEWDATMNVNLRAVYLCAKYAIPALRAARGNIVNVGSIFGLKGSGTHDSVYCTSKGGVINLTRDLAVELAPDIRVNCICPGYVDTDMLRELGQYLGKGDVEAGYAMLSKGTPLKRVGRPSEIADTIVYLASDIANFVTGSIYVADGGTVARV